MIVPRGFFAQSAAKWAYLAVKGLLRIVFSVDCLSLAGHVRL